MSSSLRNRTIAGAKWNLAGNLGQQLARFGIGIILARLLTPQDYGIIGMISIFLALGDTLVESGFSQAIIHKKDPGDQDISTVFSFNILVAILIFILLFVFSGSIASFFNQQILKPIIRVLGLGIIIRSFTLAQNTLFTKQLKFREISILNIISTFISAAVAIPMALRGYGVWSLVGLSIVKDFSFSVMIWLKSEWKPGTAYSFASLAELSKFGSRMLAVGLLDTFFMNIYQVLIGRYFSAGDLGLYTRAIGYRNLISKNLLNVINSVAFPAFAAINAESLPNDFSRIKYNFKKMSEVVFFISVPSLLALGFLSKEIIVILITDKWIGAAPLLSVLCFAGVLYPIHGIQSSVLKATGKVNNYFILMVAHKIAIILTIIALFSLGVMGLVIGQVITMVFVYMLGAIMLSSVLSYPIIRQVGSQMKYLLLGFISFYGTGSMLKQVIENDFYMIISLLVIGGSFYLLSAKILKMQGYSDSILIARRIFKQKIK